MNLYKPRQIGIELVKGCNFSCQMCPVPLYRAANAWDFMAMEYVAKIVTEITEHDSIDTIWLAHFGEPLAHPKLRECLQLLERVHQKFPRKVILHTNASLLSKEKASALLQTKAITHLTFSFDGFGDKESFEYLRGKHFDKVIANIRSFAEQAKQVRPDLNLATCSVIPKQSELLDWAGEIPGADETLNNLQSLFEPMGVTVQSRDMIDFSGNEQLPVSGAKKERIFGGCHFVEEDSLYFAASGKAQPCCAVFNEEFNIGSIADANFTELLNNQTMNTIRHQLRLDKREDLAFCKNCSLSIGTEMNNQQLMDFWHERQHINPLSTAEKQHIFGIFDPEQQNSAGHLTKMLEQRALAQQNNTDSPLPFGNIDALRYNGSQLEITAWAADEIDAAPLTAINVLVDGQAVKFSDIRFTARSDVAQHFQKENWLFSGMTIVIDNISAGSHSIQLDISNSSGQTLQLQKQRR